jgi:hypothetical protein
MCWLFAKKILGEWDRSILEPPDVFRCDSERFYAAWNSDISDSHFMILPGCPDTFHTGDDLRGIESQAGSQIGPLSKEVEEYQTVQHIYGSTPRR